MPTDAPLRTMFADIAFPPMLSAAGAKLLAMQYQFERSQYWSGRTMREAQLAQLELLLIHCDRTVPFYAERFRAAGIVPGRELTMAAWRRLKPLSRADVQAAGKLLHSTAVPGPHGRIGMTTTSGSTGMPVTALRTEISTFLWEAVALRGMLWAGLDLGGKLAMLRADPTDRLTAEGQTMRDFGPPASLVFHTGPAVWLDIRRSTAEQAEFLARHDPSILFSFPSNIALVARHCAEAGIALPNLRTIRTFGEVVTDDFRTLCREAWGATVSDVYSAEELGQIALQCPGGTHYHAQSEVILTEILDDSGKPCRPGQLGRVVLTPLHNFAMPLLRYDIGDYAEVGGKCACGRTLPVLTRILGRTRNRVALPGGEQRFASFRGLQFARVAALKQYQLVQTTTERIEVRAVLHRKLTAEEEAWLTGVIRDGLGYPFEVAFVPVAAIARTASGKYEDFRSEVA